MLVRQQSTDNDKKPMLEDCVLEVTLRAAVRPTSARPLLFQHVIWAKRSGRPPRATFDAKNNPLGLFRLLNLFLSFTSSHVDEGLNRASSRPSSLPLVARSCFGWGMALFIGLTSLPPGPEWLKCDSHVSIAESPSHPSPSRNNGTENSLKYN
jgi:hypothetical protein